jgi:hypothetical protein
MQAEEEEAADFLVPLVAETAAQVAVATEESRLVVEAPEKAALVLRVLVAVEEAVPDRHGQTAEAATELQV